MELLPLVLLVAVFYLFIIRPQRTRAREMSRIQGALTPGQTVMTGAGLIATVAEVGDDEVHLEVSPGVRNRYARQAVVRVIDDPSSPQPEDATTSDVTAEPDRRPDAEPPVDGR